MTNEKTLGQLIQDAQNILKPLEEDLENVNEQQYDIVRDSLERLEDLSEDLSSCDEELVERMDGIVSRIQKNINKLQEKAGSVDLEPFEDSIETIEDFLKELRKSIKDQPINIIVNGQIKSFDGKKITWTELVNLAYPDAEFKDTIVYTITYTEGPKQNPEGTLNKGHSVKVVCDMEFDVERTDKS